MIGHYSRRDRNDGVREAGPKRSDIAAVPLFLLSQGRFQHAAMYLRKWPDWYAYEVCEHMFGYALLAQSIGSQPQDTLRKFTDILDGIGPLTAALSFQELPKRTRRTLVGKISKLCKTTGKLDRHSQPYLLEDGLRKAVAIALPLGLDTCARIISTYIPNQRPHIWEFRRNYHGRDLFPFLFRTALVSAVKNTALHEKDILPKELVPICASITKDLHGKEFRERVKKELRNQRHASRAEEATRDDFRGLSYKGGSQEADDFIDRSMESLLGLTSALSTVLRAPAHSVDREFIGLLDVWEEASKPKGFYRPGELEHFFRLLGLEVVLFVFSVRNELKVSSVRSSLKIAHAFHIDATRLVKIIAILAKRPSFQELAGAQARKAHSLIENEDEVEYRATLFGDLGRAMLSASTDEASAYFRCGLEQMDAIGSGDYQFTNELLILACAIKGAEIKEQAFHTLTNVFELNMGDDTEELPWSVFGCALSRTAGLRGLAKLSRWDDRSKISFANTLLPYLTALVEDGKIDPKDALALNRLAVPVEYQDCGTKKFAQAISDKAGSNQDVIGELIQQSLDNNADGHMSVNLESINLQKLASISERALGSSSETTEYLMAAHRRLDVITDTISERRSYHGMADAGIRRQKADTDRKKRAELAQIAAGTNPADYAELAAAISAYNDLEHTYDFRSGFFSALRAKVSFDYRSSYINNIFKLENLDFYSKLVELKKCRHAWDSSSIALEQVYKDNAIPLLTYHADDLIIHDSLSSYDLWKVSDLTGVPTTELVVELIKLFGRRDRSIVGTVWLGLASIICPRADEGEGQLALERLLNSNAAKLANKVIDGVWQSQLYPKNDVSTIATGLVWRMLGSPRAEERWRAAHSVRCFARLGRWEIIDALVHGLEEALAGPFQAAELPFYFLHARLWLLITLARIALEYPQEVARYNDRLFRIATDKDHPHVLIQHFAAKCLLTCIDVGHLAVDSNTEIVLRHTGISPYPLQNTKNGKHRDLYHKRPDSAPEPKFEFDLDYDFRKYDVDALSRVFDRPCWEVADMIAEIVHQLDPEIKSMYESGGRESSYGHGPHEKHPRYHTYGQQLGWHGLFLAAGRLLKKFPVTSDPCYEDDPWEAWLASYLLTRNDGQWLSDGTDRTPLDTSVTLLETRKKGLAITGNQEDLLYLAGLTSETIKELVVDGYWHSADGVNVSISSALVPVDKAEYLARCLIREDPMLVWVPHYRENEEHFYSSDEKKGYTPWIVNFSVEPKLDEHDPYGVPCANSRPRLAREFSALCSLERRDGFGRIWHDKCGKPMLRAEAWGREDGDSEGGLNPEHRLVCSAPILRKVLKKYDKDLLLLIKLQRYEGQFREQGKWTHTVAVVRINKALKYEYFKGRVNHLHRSSY